MFGATRLNGRFGVDLSTDRPELCAASPSAVPDVWIGRILAVLDVPHTANADIVGKADLGEFRIFAGGTDMNKNALDMAGFAWQLVQRPRGSEAAEVLLSALCLDGLDLDRAERAAPATLPTVRRPSGLPLTACGDDATSMDRLVRDEILGWTWQTTGGVRWQSLAARAAGDQIMDAVATSFAGGTFPAGPDRDLITRTSSAGRHRDLDLGPNAALIRQVLTRVGELPRACRQGQSPPVFRQWVSAVQEAGWAVRFTDRARPAAAAYLLAVREWSRSGPLCRSSYEAWQVGNGLLQGLVVHDVLGDDAMKVLVERWHQLTGRI